MKEYNFSQPGRKNNKDFFNALFIAEDDSSKTLRISKEASSKINELCSKNSASRAKFVPNEISLGVFVLNYMKSTYTMMAYQAPDDKKEIAKKRTEDLLKIFKIIYEDLHKKDNQGNEDKEYWDYLYNVFLETATKDYDDNTVLEHHALNILYDCFFISLSDSNFKLQFHIDFFKKLMISNIAALNLTNTDAILSAATQYWQKLEVIISELYYKLTTVSLSKRFLISAATVTGLATFAAPQLLINLGIDVANSWLTNTIFATLSIGSFTAAGNAFLPRILSNTFQRKLINLAYESDVGRKLSKQEMDNWLIIAPEDSKRVYLQNGLQDQMLILDKQFALVKKISNKKTDEVHYSAKLFESSNTEPEKRSFVSRLLALGFTIEEIRNLRHTKTEKPTKQPVISSKKESEVTATWFNGLINSNMPGVYAYQPASGGLQYIMLPLDMLEKEIDNDSIKKFLEEAKRVGESKAGSFRKIEGLTPTREVIFNESNLGKREFAYELRIKTSTNTKSHQRILFFELQNEDKISIHIGAWYLEEGLTPKTNKKVKAANSPLRITLKNTPTQVDDSLEKWKEKKEAEKKQRLDNEYNDFFDDHSSDNKNKNNNISSGKIKRNVMF